MQHVKTKELSWHQRRRQLQKLPKINIANNYIKRQKQSDFDIQSGIFRTNINVLTRMLLHKLHYMKRRYTTLNNSHSISDTIFVKILFSLYFLFSTLSSHCVE